MDVEAADWSGAMDSSVRSKSYSKSRIPNPNPGKRRFRFWSWRMDVEGGRLVRGDGCFRQVQILLQINASKSGTRETQI
jgi:hypothetical protein